MIETDPLDRLLALAVREVVLEDWEAMAATADDDAVPGSRRCRRKIRRIILGEGRTTGRRISGWKKAVVVALIALSSLALLGMTMAEVRAAFGNAVVTWYRRYFSVEVTRDEPDSYPRWIVEQREPSFIPNGFEADYRQLEFSGKFEIGYADANGDVKLIYSQSVILPYSTLWIDAEAKIEEITVNGWHGMLFSYDEPGKRNALTWEDGEYQYDLIGPFDGETLRRIAESVTAGKGEGR